MITSTRHLHRWWILCCLATLASRPGFAQEEQQPRQGSYLSGKQSIGVTRQGQPLDLLPSRDDLDFRTSKTRILLVAGLEGSPTPSPMVMSAWIKHHRHQRYAISALPCMNPHGQPGGTENGAGGNPAVGYPPQEKAYDSPTNPEAIYLWRWIGMHAPDLVVDVRPVKEGKTIWEIPACNDIQLQALGKLLAAQPLEGEGELAAALVKIAPCETGTIPALRVHVPEAAADSWVTQLLAALDDAKFAGPSPARAELQRRGQRTPLEVAKVLATIYGQDLPSVQYIPAVALIARVRLGQLTGDKTHLADVERIVAPYYSGEKKIELKSGSDISGHLLFTELARETDGDRRARYIDLAKAAADLAFDTAGRPRESMPSHSEMSDALFMGGPILAQVGALTDDQRYFQACWGHLQFMRKLTLRDDGLYRHSPLSETAWGRGNGFPALGLAMCMPYFPHDMTGLPELLLAQKRHLHQLINHQDPTGCWHQVIDRPESYREFTATAMIGYALSQSARDDRYANTSDENELFRECADKAWYAVNSRIGPKGRLVDVCTGTGKFPKLRDYYDRPAILGQDARGGAMALLFAVEMAERELRQKNAESK